MRDQLAKIKHLGSAKGGTEHFIHQRVTAVFMVPLLIWFVVTVVLFVQQDANNLPWFMTSPPTIIGAILFILVSFYHAWLGLRVVIEDYIHCNALKIAALLTMYAVIITTVIAGLVAVFSIYILLRVS
jgi:succinate dehydrogenase / fumarate reductase membrane anchor subunit